MTKGKKKKREEKLEGGKEGGERQSKGDLDAVSRGPISVSHVKTQNPVWLDSREKNKKGKKKLGARDLGDKFHFLAAAGWGVRGRRGGGTKRDAEWGRSGEIRGDGGD